LNSAKSVEAAIDLNNRLTFLLDWELTMKCNLECDYCESGVDGGRDNSTAHPPVEECLRTIDFMFAYAENAIKDKKAGLKAVVLNVYGGESLHHPDIVEILQASEHTSHTKHLLSKVLEVSKEGPNLSPATVFQIAADATKVDELCNAKQN
jgi:MoaA/NifB/PqqE/SkfB family radical SAM enzyme